MMATTNEILAANSLHYFLSTLDKLQLMSYDNIGVNGYLIMFARQHIL